MISKVLNYVFRGKKFTHKKFKSKNPPLIAKRFKKYGK
jgi:hypothetical protein